MSKSRWARASREDLEALADAADSQLTQSNLSVAVLTALEALRASCPRLRTEAEVAAEALARLRYFAGYIDLTAKEWAELRALAKEPTR